MKIFPTSRLGKWILGSLFGVLALALVGAVALVLIWDDAFLVAQVKILEKEPDRLLFGGIGNSGAIGCVSNLLIEPNSSLSFRCGTTEEFSDWLYVFSFLTQSYVCPANKFSVTSCLSCDECSFKLDRLKELDVSADSANGSQ